MEMERSAPDAAEAIAARLKVEREGRGWSLAELAERSGVSKAMISKIERREASPTATVLGKLSGAFGLPLSVLMALAEQGQERLMPRAAQPVWRDPETGYLRRAVSPPAGGGLELVEVELPAGVAIAYPAAAFVFQAQQVLVVEGQLVFQEGDALHRLDAGDCLALGPPSDCVFRNDSDDPVRYLVALARR